MMVDNQVVMAWALELGKQAFTEAKSGDVSLLNRLGGNKSFKMFMDNVVGTGYVKAEQFPAYYTVAWTEIRRLYEDVQKQEEVHAAVDKVAQLESKLDALTAQLTAFIESQKPEPVAEAVEPPAKKPGKKPAKVETTEETETPAEETESEA